MSDQEIEHFISLVNMHMQGTYSSSLGHSTWAYDLSDEIGRGMAHAIRQALKDLKKVDET